MSDEPDLNDLSLSEMFRLEVETRAAAMTAGLLGLEREAPAAPVLVDLMRNAHSIKGAANIVDRSAATQVAHAMEDYFVAAQRGNFDWSQERIDLLLAGVDLLTRVAAIPDEEVAGWQAAHQEEIERFIVALSSPVAPRPAAAAAHATPAAAPVRPAAPEVAAAPTPEPAPAAATPSSRAGPAPALVPSRALRVTADNLSRLLALAGEAIVGSRWVDSFSTSLLRLKRLQSAAAGSLEQLRDSLLAAGLDERSAMMLADVQRRLAEAQGALGRRLDEFEGFDRRFLNLSKRLYQEVLACRMRPFADGVQGFSRLVRDTARTLEKKARLEIVGEHTPVDREILERMEAPLGHLLRNAVDHGLESPAERVRAGKPPMGQVRLEARHSAGMLQLEVGDDGAGIDLEAVRAAVVEKGLTSADLAAALTDAELLEFLFLPGFTMKRAVTQISGRGVGLDAVQAMVKEVGGTVRLSSRLGQGSLFQLHLPLTLSVLRTLLVEIAGEPYAFPLARIGAAVKVPRSEVESVEGRQHFRLGEQQIGLITAHQLLERPNSHAPEAEVAILVLGEKSRRYGVVVDRLLGEHELVVRPLDPRLGKVQDIAAAALMPDQSPVLIVDVDDLLRSIEILVSGDRLTPLASGARSAGVRPRKRVLVVDDSLTVRELERKLIGSRGYEVDIAIDGMDGWNAVRTGSYDLVVTDIDMPRLDGIELVTMIKQDARLHALPVMIVSYKDRDEDRQRGLVAGADYYLTKGSFHDETLLRAVADLIGEAQA